MAPTDMEPVRRWTEAFNARDIEALITYCDPDIEFHSAFAAVGGAIYRGHDGMRQWHRDLEDIWGKEIRLEIDAYFDVGEHVLTIYEMHGQGQHSGVEVAMSPAAVSRWREGLMVYTKVYTHREDALRDLGVSENELEPISP